jgi:hypothetical protein
VDKRSRLVWHLVFTLIIPRGLYVWKNSGLPIFR